MDSEGKPVDPHDLARYVRDIENFPKEGVTFRDITPLLNDANAFSKTIDAMAEPFQSNVDLVCGTEARGFILAGPVAKHFNAGFVPVRKAGKLPWDIEREEYELEYGTDLLEIHRDAIRPGQRVLIVDDVMATGGTAAATAQLVGRLGGTLVGCSFLIELACLDGRKKLPYADIFSLITYP